MNWHLIFLHLSYFLYTAKHHKRWGSQMIDDGHMYRPCVVSCFVFFNPQGAMGCWWWIVFSRQSACALCSHKLLLNDCLHRSSPCLGAENWGGCELCLSNVVRVLERCDRRALQKQLGATEQGNSLMCVFHWSHSIWQTDQSSWILQV